MLSLLVTHNQIERYTSDIESLKDDMRDLFGNWEDGEGDMKLKTLGNMTELNELSEETQLVVRDVSESVDTFKVSEGKAYVCGV